SRRPDTWTRASSREEEVEWHRTPPGTVATTLSLSPRHGIQVNGHLSGRISRRKAGFQPAFLRRVLTLPFDLLARTRPRAKRRTLAPWAVRYRERSYLNSRSSSQCMLSTPQWPRAAAAMRSVSHTAEEMK